MLDTKGAGNPQVITSSKEQCRIDWQSSRQGVDNELW